MTNLVQPKLCYVEIGSKSFIFILGNRIALIMTNRYFDVVDV